MTARSVTAVLWLALTAFHWLLLAWIARIPTAGAVAITNLLFVLALPVTFGAVVAALSLRSKPRLLVLRLIAPTLGVLLGIGLLELAAAARLIHWDLLFMSLSGEQQYYVPDPELGFRHTPGIRWSGRPRSDVEIAWGLPASRSDPITVTYDRRGYRNAKQPSRSDIVLIGDSYVEGAYVSDDQIISRFLEDRLGRPVANLGVAGYGTAQELIVLKRDAIPLKPEVVIWFFFEGNDLYNDQEFENTLLSPREVRASKWTDRGGWWGRSFVRNAHTQLRRVLQPLVPAQAPHFGILTAGPDRGRTVLFGPEAALPWTGFERGRWEKARAILREAVKSAREHKTHLLLVYIPIKFRVYVDFVEIPPQSDMHHWKLWPLPDLFAEFCRAEELACLDLTELLRRAVHDGPMPYSPVDSHWSAEGHQLIAQRLQQVLESAGWISAPNGRFPGARSEARQALD